MKRPACFQRQTGACRSCRLGVSQPCRGHEEPAGATALSSTGRRTPTDLWRTKHGARSVPDVQQQERSTPTARLMSSGLERSTPTAEQCPTCEAINSNSPDGCPAGEGPTSTPTAGQDRGRRATSNPSVRSALPAKDQRQLRFSSIPSWATGGERIILRSCPCNRDHAPRVSMVGNLGKSQTVLSLLPFNAQRKRACNTPF